MTWDLFYGFVFGAVPAFAIGYFWAVARTDHTLSELTPDEMNALARRVAARRALKGKV